MLLACGHAQVDARGLYVLMTHEVCQQGDVVVFCQEILREAVPEGVGIDHLGVNAVFYSIVPQALVYASLGDQPSPTVQKDEPRFHLLGFKPFQGCRMTTSYYHFDMPSLLKLFRYDKLNRIKRMSTTNHSAGVSGWGTVSSQYATNYSYDWNGNLLSLRRNNENGQVMHNIQYHYPAENNRLGAITATGLNPGTYQYDALGNLVRDNAEGLTVEWNALGKVDTIRRNGVLLSTFRYSPTGQRQVKTDSSGTIFYIHDATGNVICVYKLHGDTLTATERYLYGSKRLGMLEQQVWMTANSIGLQDSNTIGVRVYEFTDHLGNVTYTAQDRKCLVQDSYGQRQFIPFMINYTGYYPFGFPMPGRSFDNGGYRYFFNGQEADNEVLGEGVSLTAEFWQYDSRLGRRWNVDPVFKEKESPYACFAGNPVWFADPKGDSLINGYSNRLSSAEEAMRQSERFLNSLSQSDEQYLSAKQDYDDKTASYYRIKRLYDIAQNIITDFKEHSPEMYNKLNHLRSPNGVVDVDVFVFVNYDLNNGKYSGQSEIDHHFFEHANSVFGGSHYFFLFDSENDIFSTNAVKMTINPRYSDQIGKSFAHEGGHIYYEVTDPVGYANWLEKNGNQSAKSGHLKDKDGKEKNPSGQKALEWESEY